VRFLKLIGLVLLLSVSEPAWATPNDACEAWLDQAQCSRRYFTDPNTGVVLVAAAGVGLKCGPEQPFERFVIYRGESTNACRLMFGTDLSGLSPLLYQLVADYPELGQRRNDAIPLDLPLLWLLSTVTLSDDRPARRVTLFGRSMCVFYSVDPQGRAETLLLDASGRCAPEQTISTSSIARAALGRTPGSTVDVALYGATARIATGAAPTSLTGLDLAFVNRCASIPVQGTADRMRTLRLDLDFNAAGPMRRALIAALVTAAKALLPRGSAERAAARDLLTYLQLKCVGAS
jgi:hypothetical protein